MKISEMTNDQAAECMIRLAVPFGHLCDDDGITEIIKKYNEMKNVENIRAVGRILPEVMAYALKTHKEDVFDIVGALIGKTPEEVSKMNFAATLKAVRDSYDEVFRDFFISSIKPGNAIEE